MALVTGRTGPRVYRDQMDQPNATAPNQEDEFTQRARKSRYPEYLMAFSVFASGGALIPALVPAALELRLAWALAGHDVKGSRLRGLVDFEAEIERLRRTATEAPDASSYGGAEAEPNDRRW